MGLTKQYLRYVPAGTFNIIASSNCNVQFVTLDGQEGRFVAVGASEHIIIWDLRLGEKARVLSGEKAQVTCLCANPNKSYLAAGYSDGNVQIYDLRTAEIVSIFSGHKTDVTSLAYDQFGHKLASGSKDTDVIIWDTVAETGLCRLFGHKGPITQLVFMATQNVLITGSKDTLVKFWDLDTQHCFRTLTGHRTEVWSVTLMKEDRYLVTGCGDSELRVWKLTNRDLLDDKKLISVNELSKNLEITDLTDENDLNHPLQCHKAGSLMRTGKGRVVYMSSDSSGQVLGCHGTDQQVELFLFCSDDEAKIRHKKRLKKLNKKLKNQEKDENEEKMETNAPDVPKEHLELSLRDEVKRLTTISCSSKLKSLDILLGRGSEVRVTTSLNCNVVELYSFNSDSKDEEARLLRSIRSQGHRSEIRAVAFSSDSLAIVSGSAESIKLWNRSSQVCLRTIQTGYVLSLCFVPGDRHILAGLKDGKLLIIDIGAGDILEEIPAHSTELWSICLQPDMRGCVTGGGDSTVKFWNFELITDESSESKAKVLSLLHTRTLKLEESILCVKISPNGKFIAVALLDSTVKIFFVDTFKFYLSLYGHKLPVLSMDISSDSTIIATGSADRCVKLWGMDFGDCHKSLFAHDDSVTGVVFVPRTHYLFTCGRDGNVKEWDADNYQRIITLPGHAGESWGVAVAPNAVHVVSCGADHVLRMFERTDQPLVLEDEREEEREQEENELATGTETSVPGRTDLILPTKKTIGSEKAAESILECLELCESYSEQLKEHEAIQDESKDLISKPPPPPLMQAYQVTTVEDFLLETLRRIRTSDLEEALLLLPFNSACELLKGIHTLASRGDNTELVCRVLMFLLNVHHAPLVASKALLPILHDLQIICFQKVNELRDMIGYNLYGMLYMQREIEASEGIQLFRDATIEKKNKDKKRKQREKLKRSIIMLS